MSWYAKLIATLRPDRLDADLDCEMQFHLAQRTDEFIAHGLSAKDARREALLLFGNRTATQEATRDRDIVRWLEATLQDVRYAARTLRRNPGFAVSAVLSLALGIGANTALFSLLDALLLKLLPVEQPQQLVRLLTESGSFRYPAFELMRTHSQTLSGVMASGRLNPDKVQEHGETLTVSVQKVSGEYFDVLGVPAVRGRVFHGPDAKSPDGAIAVISDRFWRSHYGGKPGALGAHFRYQSRDFTVAGVAPPGFGGVVVDHPSDIWVPIEQAEAANSMLFTKGSWLQVIGRLQPGKTRAQVSAEASAMLGYTIQVEPGGAGISGLRGRFSRPLLALECIVGLVLLLTCCNLANLMMAAAAARHAEISVRQALGAARGRLVRQMLTESLLVSLLGASLAILVARWLSNALLHFLPPDAAPAMANLAFYPDTRVLGFTAAVALVTTLLFGLAPALRATRPSIAPSLRTTGASARSSGRRTSQVLVVGEVALCTVILMAAGLFVRSLGHLRDLDPGFVPEHLLVADVTPDSSSQVQSRMEALSERVAALPGVRAVGYSNIRQLSGFDVIMDISVDGYIPQPGESQEASALHVSSGFFDAMGTRILRGRDFTRHDDAAPVALVNESFSRHFFMARDPVGQHFRVAGPTSGGALEIIGVVQDVKWIDLRRNASAMYYRPVLQAGAGSPTLAVRSAGDLSVLTATLERLAHEIDPHFTLTDVVPFTEVEDRTLIIERMVAQVSAAFGVLAVVVASVGLYGVLAYGVARRTREIGVRMALGASRAGMEWMVLRESLLLLMCGAALGVPAALAAARLIASMLFGTTPADPVTIAAALGLMIAVSLTAAFVPARRAARVDPNVALRYE